MDELGRLYWMIAVLSAVVTGLAVATALQAGWF
jgi:hypothetical protein